MPTHAVRIIRHEAVPKTGNFEVRFADGRASRYFYYDKSVNRNKALELAKSIMAVAAIEHDRRAQQKRHGAAP